MDNKIEIHTGDVLLRPLRACDGDQLVNLLNDYEVSRWLTVVPYPYTHADFNGFLTHLKETSALNGLAITCGDEFMGMIGLKPTLGYWLGRKYQGRGIMTKSAQALVDWGFGNLEIDLIGSGYFEGNIASKTVLTKVGFRETGAVTTDHSLSQNKKVPLINVALHRCDWAMGT